MKKQYLKYLLITICLCIFHFDNVFAYNARVGTTSSHSTGQANGYYNISILYNGTEYKSEGYCANQGASLPNYYNQDVCKIINGEKKCGYPEPNNYNCTVENNPEIYSILTSGGSHGDKQQKLWEYIQSGTATTVPNGALLTKQGENGHTITYLINPAIDVKYLSVTCGTGCANVSISGSTLTVTLQENACSFTINVTYSGPVTDLGTTTTGGKVLHCRRSSGDQDVYMPLNDTTGNTDKTNLTFSDSLERCDEKPDKCNEKTDIQIPTYCDDPNDEQITITAPKNVKYCILNGEDDAGSTYQMLDGQVKEDNPYCSVYCKEDYTMTMPGAQYTTSGRYFTLKRTVVEATRTCYTTNPSESQEKTNIDIKKFIADVKAAQEAIIKAKNEYEYSKAFHNASENEKEVNCGYRMVNGVQQPITSKQYIKSFDYKVYSLEGYNPKTGEYATIKESTAHDTVTWGGCYAGTKPKIIDPGSALGNLNAAVNNLKKLIEHMEDCYNWKNNLCMNTIVQFDYKEQYDINYELVPGTGGTFSNDKATYSTSETIDNNYTADSGGSLDNYKYVNCTESNCDHTNIAKRISTLVQNLYHSKIEVSGKAEYENTNTFKTNYPHGTVEEAPKGSEGPFKDYEYLGAVFPVALKTPFGVYKWTLNFSNLGQYNDAACRNGRLDKVAEVQGKTVGAGIEYVCVYVVDCDDCDYECVGEGCYIPDVECPECDVYCTNCIFDGNVTYTYEAKSLNVFNPNNRDLGSNWTNEKGEETIKDIETDGEEIYKEAEYTFVITPYHMKEIRDYNKKDNKNYIIEDLTYGDVEGVSNIAGYSKFLRGDSPQYSDKNFNTKFFKSATLNTKWELWKSGIQEAIVPVENNVGPAWK